MINEIIAHFDFEKVSKVMHFLDWKWAEIGIPTIQDLKDSAVERLESAIEQVLSSKNNEHHDIAWISSTGGFKAMAWKTKKGKLAKLQLEFIVSDWDSEND
jgi:hypothetical protein